MPVSHHPHREEFFCSIQSKPTFHQPEATDRGQCMLRHSVENGQGHSAVISDPIILASSWAGSPKAGSLDSLKQ